MKEMNEVLKQSEKIEALKFTYAKNRAEKQPKKLITVGTFNKCNFRKSNTL